VSGRAALALAAGLLATACSGSTRDVTPGGVDASARTRALGAGAALLQGDAPVDALDIHLVGYHPLADDPDHQMLAHHYCRQVNEDFAQCALFDGDGADANLVGIEYIVSGRMFEGFPDEERAYWHPHNYEILSGQLVAPGLPERVERELMRDKIDSYGKTWHLWPTNEGIALPVGPPRLAWSFNRDGEIDPALLARGEQETGIDVRERREARAPLREGARRQVGVERLLSPRPARGRETRILPVRWRSW